METILILIGIYIIINLANKAIKIFRSPAGMRRSDRKYSQTDSSYDKTAESYFKHNTSRKTSTKPRHAKYTIELPKDFQLTEEFKKAFDLMENSSDHIFITGKAGTGKSTLLQYFRKNSKKNIAVLAPTGVAAINVGGKTIHSFFKLPPRLIQKDDIRTIRGRETIRKLDTVVVDEVSMVRADLMDGIDIALRRNRGNYGIPFGGTQIILIGDLHQLPPVVDSDAKTVFDKLYKSPYFFSANVIKDISLKSMELKQIHRQTGVNFIELLNSLRANRINHEGLSIFNSRVQGREFYCKDNRIILTTTNDGANHINEDRLRAINEKEYSYEAQVIGEFDESAYPAELSLRLKKGAQVMLIRNDMARRWVNGTLGIVESLSPSSIRLTISGETYDIQKETWEKIDYRYSPEQNRVEAYVIGSFRQYPIKLAWAITIHKSQGKTFEKVLIDLERGAFAHGQAYVALSRCTTLDGIILKRPLTYKDVIFDEEIYEFEDRVLPKIKVIECQGCGQKLRVPLQVGKAICPKCKTIYVNKDEPPK